MTFQFGPQKSLDAVPEQFRALYAAEPAADGSFNVDPRFAGAAEAIVGLNKALTNERKTKTPPVDLSALKDYGETPEAIAEAFNAKLDEASKGAHGKARMDVEKIRADLAKAHAGEIDAAKRRAQALQDQLYRLLVENKAREAAAAAKGEPDLLMPFVKERVVVEEKDGQFGVFVIDDAKAIRYSPATGQPMTIPELIAEMKANTRYGRLFASEAPAGGGAPPSGASRGNPAPMGGDSKTPVDRIRAALDSGAYRKEK